MKRPYCLFLAAVFTLAPVALGQAGWQTLGDFTSSEKRIDGIDVQGQRGRIRITALSAKVIRVQYSRSTQGPDRQSFAVVTNAFQGETPQIEVTQSGDAVSLNTGPVSVRVYKPGLRLSFLDAKGEVISQDQADEPVVFDGAGFQVVKAMPEDEHYFGLGDKTGPLDHRTLAFTMWNTDAFGWQESTDPLYKDIPFIFGFRNGAAYGIFLDNTYRSSFDFGKRRHDAYSFGAEGGDLDYYFIYGPEPKAVLQEFTQLVGRMPLPPLFALGYQQCRYSYYPESQVRDIAARFRKDKIPADVIYLDIDYQQNNRPFTVDHERFPNFDGLISDLGKEGFKVIAITDLHLAKLPGYKPYDEGMKADAFVKNPDGSVYVGKVWPGESVFPDFTRESVRRWWGTLYSDFVKAGIRGFWNDMNEPAVFEVPSKTMPLDIVHSVEGRKTDHREIHNVFGMQNARGTYEGLLRLNPNQRPFVLTRAAYAGTERYASTWTGDNTASWNHMRLSVPQLLNLGLSGLPLAGDDIGGFNGSPTPELLTRWMELGVFNPIYRNHAAKGTRFREPWVDGPEHEAIRRRYIETRYQLLPYIYTGIEEASRTGVPLMRPMFLEFPNEGPVALKDDEFMFGPSLLVAPKAWPFVEPYQVSLPAGEWFDYWTGVRVDGHLLKADPEMSTLPVYVRAGSIIPEQPVVQSTDDVPSGPLTLQVYPGPGCQGSLYSDDGTTFAYKKGQSLRLNFTCEAAPDHVRVNISSADGAYRPWFKQIQLQVFGLSENIKSVNADGQQLAGTRLQSGVAILPPLAWSPAAHSITIDLQSK
jgi:alpha-glucosidase